MTIVHNLFFFLASFAVGIIAESYSGFGFSLVLGSGLLTLVFLIYYYVSRVGVYLLATLIFFGLTLGAGRLLLVESLIDRELDQYLGQEITFSGTVRVAPDERELKTQIVVKPDGRRLAILLDLPRTNDWHYGDRVEVAGILTRPYRGANFIIDYELKSPTPTLLPHTNFNFRRSLFQIKDGFLSSTEALYPEPMSGLIAGLLFGEKHALGQVWEERFRVAGLSHLVVLSGYNLTLVATIILSFLSLFRLPQRSRFFLGALGIIVFTLMTGASAATVRAALMALVALLARVVGREYQATNALFLAGFAMLLFEPRLLTSDLGFQLSFLATFGLIHFSPIIERLFTFWPKMRLKLWREVTVTTLAVQIFLLPWILYKFGTISLFGLPANILVLPLVPPVMLLGFLASAVGIVSTILAWPVMALSYPLISLILWLTKLFATPTVATIEVVSFSGAIVLTCYLVYLITIVWHNRASNSLLTGR